MTAVAYPWGRRDADFSQETVAVARGLAFDAGFATDPGFATPAEDRLARSRFVVMADVSAAELAHRITHTWPR